MTPGLCECGCGQPTKLAFTTRKRHGWVKGEPLRFIFGHQNRGRAKSPETRAKIAASLRGRKGQPHSPEARSAMSDLRTRRVIPVWSAEELYWLAGLLEGEGCFSTYRSGPYVYPVIALAMCDRDVVDRAAELLNVSVQSRPPRGDRKRTVYVLRKQGKQAVAAMQRLYPILSRRRQARIDELLAEFSHLRHDVPEHPGPCDEFPIKDWGS